VPSIYTLLILLLFSRCPCQAGTESIERIKRMITMTQPLEGTFSISNTATTKRFDNANTQVFEIGIQEGTWYVKNPRGPRDSPNACGQSYAMTWVFGGNTVHVLPRKDTIPLVSMAGDTGLNPERICQGQLAMLEFVTRFGLHIAQTNGFRWDGLKFSSKGARNMNSSGSVSGEIEVVDGIPLRVVTDWQGQDGAQRKVFHLKNHDSNGFPTSIEVSNNGLQSQKSIHISNLRFGPRNFPDGDGYTPSFLGESGREYTLFYTNRVAQVIDENGKFETRDAPLVSSGSDSLLRSRSFWLGLVGLAAAFTTAVWLFKR